MWCVGEVRGGEGWVGEGWVGLGGVGGWVKGRRVNGVVWTCGERPNFVSARTKPTDELTTMSNFNSLGHRNRESK